MRTEGWELRYKSTGTAVDIGAGLVDFRCDAAILTGGRPPHKLGSTGRVYVKSDGLDFGDREYFPGVFGLEWERV